MPNPNEYVVSGYLDARFRNPPIGGFKHVECTSRNAMDCFITENLVLPVMHDSVQSVLVKQHGYIQWTNCTKNTLLGN